MLMLKRRLRKAVSRAIVVVTTMTYVGPTVFNALIVELRVVGAETVRVNRSVALATKARVPEAGTAELRIKGLVGQVRFVGGEGLLLLRSLTRILGRGLLLRGLGLGGLVLARIHRPKVGLGEELIQDLAVGAGAEPSRQGDLDRLQVDLVRQTPDLRGDRRHGREERVGGL